MPTTMKYINTVLPAGIFCLLYSPKHFAPFHHIAARFNGKTGSGYFIQKKQD
jgi:hypothetical protein